MGTVVNMNPEKELGRFVDYMYRDEQGWVYSPTKDPNTKEFTQFFFEWPRERGELLAHIQRWTDNREVYISPSIFVRPGAEKTDFKGTRFIWVEFDGQLPDKLEAVPQPGIRIRSSTDKHEHWYWELERFETDISVLEDVSQRITYHLGGDLGCWNANRVLRPPATTHHESARTTTVLKWAPEVHPITVFSGLPAVPVRLLATDDIGAIPPVLNVLMLHKWTPENMEFFQTKTMEVGTRSSALTKLCFICLEVGMSSAEALSVISNADERWGKFKGRTDRKAQLLGIINYCRGKLQSSGKIIPLEDTEQAVEERLRVYNFEEFMKTELRVEWVIEGLIHKKGFVIVSGPPGVGKSQLTIRAMIAMATGEKFLKWTPTRPMKILFVSMEMPHEELLYLMEQMAIPENELLRENLHILPLGYSLQMTKSISQAEFAAVVDKLRPDGIIFDSLGAGLAEDIKSEKIILETFDYVNRVIRNYFGAFVWFIHHNRKEQIGNKKPNKLDDLFGSQYIGATLTTGISLWPNAPNIEVSCMKLRLAKAFNPFIIRRQPGLDFKIIEGIVDIPGDNPIFGTDETDLSDTI